jgi:hypothetical protein
MTAKTTAKAAAKAPKILDGKVAIVTGAGRGLGRVMTLGLLDAGARVAAVELDAPAIEETQDAAEDRGAGERFLGIGADVARDDSGAKILRATTDRFGRLDISHQQCRHQHRPVAWRRPARWESVGDDARRISPGDRRQRGRSVSDDASRIADAAGAALGPHHQCHDEPRHDVAKPHVALRRLKSRQRGYSHGLGSRTRRQRRDGQCAGAGRRRRHAARAAVDGAGSFPAYSAGRHGDAAGLAVLERVRCRQRAAFHRHAVGCFIAARGGRKQRPALLPPGSSSGVRRSCPNACAKAK